MNGFIGGYRIDLEDKPGLLATAVDPVHMLMLGDTPERVDPRNSPLKDQGFLQVEDQGQQGSCQGQALSDNGEHCYAFATGKVIQLSRQYAYIGSQVIDRISGDRGSTLSGGTKLALNGICRESIGPYARSYPGHGYITQAMKDDAENFKLQSHTDIKSAEHVRQFIGSGIGIVQIGIAWGSAMDPDGSGCITSFSPGSGGHSVVFCGYVPDSDVGRQSGAGWWCLVKNSWSQRWGVKGYAFVSPKAIDQMLRHQWTVMLGRSDMKTPDIRTIPHDFTQPGKGIRV